MLYGILISEGEIKMGLTKAITSQSPARPALDLHLSKFAGTAKLQRMQIYYALYPILNRLNVPDTIKVQQLYKKMEEVTKNYSLNLFQRFIDNIFSSGYRQTAREALMILAFADAFTQWTEECVSLGDSSIIDNGRKIFSLAMTQIGQSFGSKSPFSTTTMPTRSDIPVEAYAAHALRVLCIVASDQSAILNLCTAKNVDFVPASDEMGGTARFKAQVSLKLPWEITHTEDLTLIFDISSKDWLKNDFCKNYVTEKGLDQFTLERKAELDIAKSECSEVERQFIKLTTLLPKEQANFSTQLEKYFIWHEETKNEIYQCICSDDDKGTTEKISKFVTETSMMVTQLVKWETQLTNLEKKYVELSNSFAKKIATYIHKTESYQAYVENLSRAFSSDKSDKSDKETATEIAKIKTDTATDLVEYKTKSEQREASRITLSATVTELVKKINGATSAVNADVGTITATKTSWDEAKATHQRVITPIKEFNTQLQTKVSYITELLTKPPVIVTPSDDETGEAKSIETKYREMQVAVGSSGTAAQRTAVKKFLDAYFSMINTLTTTGTPPGTPLSSVIEDTKLLFKEQEGHKTKLATANDTLVNAHSVLFKSGMTPMVYETPTDISEDNIEELLILAKKMESTIRDIDIKPEMSGKALWEKINLYLTKMNPEPEPVKPPQVVELEASSIITPLQSAIIIPPSSPSYLSFSSSTSSPISNPITSPSPSPLLSPSSPPSPSSLSLSSTSSNPITPPSSPLSLSPLSLSPLSPSSPSSLSLSSTPGIISNSITSSSLPFSISQSSSGFQAVNSSGFPARRREDINPLIPSATKGSTPPPSLLPSSTASSSLTASKASVEKPSLFQRFMTKKSK
ncbi:TPA: hypothetical protein PXM28_001127 [Yersinia enterocolitica]|nr:hypothetical protein [Yersinia enterocolitica]